MAFPKDDGTIKGDALGRTLAPGKPVAKKDEDDTKPGLSEGLISALLLMGLIGFAGVITNAFETFAAILIVGAVVGVVYAYGGFDGIINWVSSSEWGQKAAAWIREKFPELAKMIGMDGASVIAALEKIDDPKKLKDMLVNVGGLEASLADAISQTIKSGVAGQAADTSEWKALLKVVSDSKVPLDKTLFTNPTAIRALADAATLKPDTKTNLFKAALVSMQVPDKLAAALAKDPQKLVNTVFSGDKLAAFLSGKYDDAFKGTLPTLVAYLRTTMDAKQVAALIIGSGAAAMDPLTVRMKAAADGMLADAAQLKQFPKEVIVELVPNTTLAGRLVQQLIKSDEHWNQFVDAVLQPSGSQTFVQMLQGGAAAEMAMKDPKLIKAVATNDGLSPQLKTELFLSAFTALKIPVPLAKVLAEDPKALVASIRPEDMQTLLMKGEISPNALVGLQTYLKASSGRVEAFSAALKDVQGIVKSAPEDAVVTRTISTSIVTAVAGLSADQIEKLDPALIKTFTAAWMGGGNSLKDNLLQAMTNPSLLLLLKSADVSLLDKAGITGEMRSLVDWLRQDSGAVGKKNIEVLSAMAETINAQPIAEEDKKAFGAQIQQLAQAIKQGDAKDSTKFSETLLGKVVALLQSPVMKNEGILSAVGEAIKTLSPPALSDEMLAMIKSGTDNPAIPAVLRASLEKIKDKPDDEIRTIYKESFAKMAGLLGNPTNLAAIRTMLEAAATVPTNLADKIPNIDKVTAFLQGLMNGKPDFMALPQLLSTNREAFRALLALDFSGLDDASVIKARAGQKALGAMLTFTDALSTEDRKTFFDTFTPTGLGLLAASKFTGIASALDTLAKKYGPQWNTFVGKLNFDAFGADLGGLADTIKDIFKPVVVGALELRPDQQPNLQLASLVLANAGVLPHSHSNPDKEREAKEAADRALKALLTVQAVADATKAMVANTVAVRRV